MINEWFMGFVEQQVINQHALALVWVSITFLTFRIWTHDLWGRQVVFHFSEDVDSMQNHSTIYFVFNLRTKILLVSSGPLLRLDLRWGFSPRVFRRTSLFSINPGLVAGHRGIFTATSVLGRPCGWTYYWTHEKRLVEMIQNRPWSNYSDGSWACLSDVCGWKEKLDFGHRFAVAMNDRPSKWKSPVKEQMRTASTKYTCCPG